MFFLKELKNFVKTNTCSEIIEHHKQTLEPSTTGINRKFNGHKTGRTSLTAKTDLLFPPIVELKKSIEELTFLPQENQEKPSIINYKLDGQYLPHHDYYDESDPDFDKLILPNGGQRRFTCLLYLNDNFTGGFTHFPRIKKRIVPETGKLIWWENTTHEGKVIPETLHSGSEITFGEKWILTIWIRLGKTNGN